MEILARGRILHAHASRQEPNLNGENQELLVHIDSNRKFELNELSDIILGKVAKGIFTFFNVSAGITYIFASIVTGSQSLAVNIPIASNLFNSCNSSEFDTGALPMGGCLNWYRLMVGSFGIIGTVIACLRGEEHRYVHITIAIVRAMVMCFMVFFSIFLIEKEALNNSTNIVNEFIYKFEFKQQMLGLAAFFSTVTMASFVPAFTQLVRNKNYLIRVMIISTIALLIQAIVFGSITASAFGRGIHPNVLLNLQPYTMGNNSFFLKTISHLVIVYPCVDALCSFMLGVVLCSNHTFTALTGKDYTGFSNRRIFKLLKFAIYLSYSIVPIVLTFFIGNFQLLVGLSGLFGVLINVLFPSLLQIVSSYKCNKLFPQNRMIAGDDTARELLWKRVFNFIFKSTFPTPYSGYYSNNFAVLGITTTTSILYVVSSYFVYSQLFT